MSTKKDRVGVDPDDHQINGWLSLSLAPYLVDSSSQSHSQATFVKRKFVKVYTCMFCKRKFYSSQALGGHQNAHKRERDVVATIYGLPKVKNGARYGIPYGPPHAGEDSSVVVKWALGLDHSNQQPVSQDPDDTKSVDLNLKL